MSSTTRSDSRVEFGLALTWMLASLWFLSSDVLDTVSRNSSFLGIPPGARNIAPWFLLACVSLFARALVFHKGVRKTWILFGFSWVVCCFVSLMVHRGGTASVGDVLRSSITLGSIPSWDHLPGLHSLPFLVAALLSASLPSVEKLPPRVHRVATFSAIAIFVLYSFLDVGQSPFDIRPSILLLLPASFLILHMRVPAFLLHLQRINRWPKVLVTAALVVAFAFAASWEHHVMGLLVGLPVLLTLVASLRAVLEDGMLWYDPISSPSSRRVISGALASAGTGLLLFGQSSFHLIARQHVERVSLDDVSGKVIALLGPPFPSILWASITASFLGILLISPFAAFFAPPRHGTKVPGPAQASSDDRRTWRLGYGAMAVWSVALGFIVRLVTLLTVAPTRTDGGDPLFYHVTANLLAQGRGFPEPLNFVAFQRWIPSALHGPAYPILLSASSRIGGTTYFDHKFLSLLVGTTIVAMTMYLAHSITPVPYRRTTTIVSGLLTSLYPNLWLIDSVLFPEGLMALLTISTVVSAYAWWRRPRFLHAALLGLLIGASALTRGEGLLLSVILVLPLFALSRVLTTKKKIQNLFLTAVCCLVVLAPWTIRNARSFDVFVPLSTNGNELFVYANCPDTYQGKFLGFWLFQCQENLRASNGEPSGDEAEKSLHWRRAGLEYAREHLSDVPRVLAARIGRQWDMFRPWQNTEFAPIEGRNKDAARIGLIFYFAMIPLALLGVRRFRRGGVPLLPIGAVFASVTATAAYAYGTTRFRAPFEPLLCLLAALGVAVLFHRIGSRWRSSPEHVASNLGGSNRVASTFVGGGNIDVTSALAASSWRSWTSVASVVAAILLALPALYRSVGSSMEEGFMLVFPELLMRGAIPNVDFLHLYGPGSLQALDLWFRLFDVTLTAERTFGLLQHILFVFGLLVLLRPWGKVASTAVALASLLFVLTPIGLQALAWNGALALSVWALIFGLRASRRGGTTNWILAGILSGLALTFRPDMVLALSLGLMVVLWRRPVRVLGSVLLGTLTGLLPLWVHIARAGPTAVIEGMILDPVFRLRAGRELPRPPSLDRLDGALQVISEKFAPWWGFPHLGAPKQLFLWFFLLPLVAFAIFLIAAKMPAHKGERRILLVVSLFGAGLLPQAIQRPDSAHFLWVSAVSWPLVIVATFEWIRQRRPHIHPRAALTAGISLFSALVLLLVPFYTVRTYADLVVRSMTGQLDVREVNRDDRFFYLGDERPWRATLEVVEDLDRLARAGERLFVGPVDLRQTAYSDVFFYHLFPELEPATYYVEMDPGLANDDVRLASDVASADWLVLTRFWSGWIEPNSSIVFGSDAPNQVVEESFCLVGSYQNDLVRLFRRCPVGDGVGPYEGPYRPEHDYAVEVLVPVPARPDGTCTPTCYGRPSESGVEIGIDTSIVN